MNDKKITKKNLKMNFTNSQGMSDTVNNKSTSLDSDYQQFLDPANFDSDPETPENNLCNKNSSLPF